MDRARTVTTRQAREIHNGVLISFTRLFLEAIATHICIILQYFYVHHIQQ